MVPKHGDTITPTPKETSPHDVIRQQLECIEQEVSTIRVAINDAVSNLEAARQSSILHKAQFPEMVIWPRPHSIEGGDAMVAILSTDTVCLIWQLFSQPLVPTPPSTFKSAKWLTNQSLESHWSRQRASS